MTQTPYIITNTPSDLQTQADYFGAEVNRRSDRLMNYFLPGLFVVGLLLAPYFNSWYITLGVGGLSLLASYSVKSFLPGTDLNQYVLSTVLALFMAQYIYHIH